MQYVKLPKKENKKTTEADLKILPLSSKKKITLFLEPSNTFYIPFHIGLNTGILFEQGAPIKDIQARLGHSRSGITLDTYSHLTEKMKNPTVDIFERLMHDVR